MRKAGADAFCVCVCVCVCVCNQSVANAFFILGLIMSLFSILAFDLYAADAPDEFGSFSRAFFSMFQVCGVVCCILVLPRNAARP